MGTESAGFVQVKGLGKRVQEAEATEADLIRDIKKLSQPDQIYIHDIVKVILDGKVENG